MNIFKRISSFASNSWRDFVDSQHLVEQEEETACLHQQTETTDLSPVINGENEMPKKFEENFVHRKLFINRDLLKKRNNKKTKTKITTKVLDDPRSPSTVFARTPILGETFVDVLSPFNVKDMLEAVQTAVECTEDTFLNTSDPVEKLEPDSKGVDLALENVAAIEDDKLIKIDEICNWNNIEYQEKPLTQSLIVETSTITGDSKDSSSVLDEKEIIANQDNKNCKVVGYCVKNEGFVNDENHGQEFAASTPKKDKSSKPINGGNNQRTPLMSIGNSPCFKVSGNNLAAKNKKFQKKSPKKRIVNNLNRKLPKAPSTPMTPLYRNPMIANNVIEFDKENF